VAASRRLDEAIAHHREGVRSNPNSAEARFSLARAFTTTGKPRDAVNYAISASGRVPGPVANGGAEPPPHVFGLRPPRR
jgi:hypothetical protein